VIDVYVYFRSSAGDDETVATMQRMQQAVRQQCGIAARLQRRRGDSGPQRTWMEIYPGIADERLQDVLAQIDAEAQRSGIAALAADGRHVETFEPIDRCA